MNYLKLLKQELFPCCKGVDYHDRLSALSLGDTTHKEKKKKKKKKKKRKNKSLSHLVVRTNFTALTYSISHNFYMYPK